MNMFIHCLSLDIREPMTQAYINVKKGDTARKLIFTFSNYGSAYHISDGCTAVFRAKKPDGTILFNSCTINGNAVEYIFTSQTVAAVGIVECEVTLADADGKQITSPRFALIVENVLYSDDEVESTNEFTKLQEALAKVSGLGSASIAMRVDGGYIQYSTDDGKTWVNLIAEADLKGDPGTPGTPGTDGTDGITPHIGENGNWYIGSTDTGKPSRGEQGAKGDTGAIGPQGPKGDTGPQGPKGDKGDKGETGATGPAGATGADGKSAYQYAVEGGYTGTETEFAAKLAQEKFANPNALTFTGAVTGSYDGSAPLSVEIPSGGGSSGGSTAEWQLLGTYTMLVSDKSLVIDLSQFEGITRFRIIGNFPKCSEECGATYFYLGTAFNHSNQPSQKQNTYAFTLLAECELVDGQLYGFIGTLDGWTYKVPASVVINTPRDSGKNTNFKIFYGNAVNDTTANTIQIWGY